MKVNKIGASSIELEVRNNLMRSVKDGAADIESYIKDTSAFKVRISQEALEALLKEGTLSSIMPRPNPQTTYNYKGEFIDGSQRGRS